MTAFCLYTGNGYDLRLSKPAKGATLTPKIAGHQANIGSNDEWDGNNEHSENDCLG